MPPMPAAEGNAFLELTLSWAAVSAASCKWHYAAMWPGWSTGLSISRSVSSPGDSRKRLLPLSAGGVLEDTIRRVTRKDHNDVSLSTIRFQKLLYAGIILVGS